MGRVSREDAIAYVEELYRSLLNREADEGGLKSHVDFLVQTEAKVGYAQILKNFLASEEYRLQTLNKYKSQIQQQIITEQNNEQDKPIINHVISLGDHCLTSALLKKYHYKKYSQPFDWLFSNIQTVLHCIEDDFSHFLDQQYHQKTLNSVGKSATSHSFYEERYQVNYPMFNHLEVTGKENYSYTERTVERFRKLLASEEPKLFVHIAKPEVDLEKSFEGVIKVLNQYTQNFKLLFIKLESPSYQSDVFELKGKKIAGHSLYTYRPISQENGVEFPNIFDELVLIRLLNQFDIQLTDL